MIYKVMLRRNIDVSIGLVNETIGKIVSVSRDRTGTITNVQMIFKSGKEHSIPNLVYKFIVMDKKF